MIGKITLCCQTSQKLIHVRHETNGNDKSMEMDLENRKSCGVDQQEYDEASSFIYKKLDEYYDIKREKPEASVFPRRH